MRRVVRIAALALAMGVLAATRASAQGGTIRGRVADTAGTPVADALVCVEATALRAMTAGNGEYVIGAVPAGGFVHTWVDLDFGR